MVMQQDALLQTKLYIPSIRPELVSRPRLLERLNAGLPMRGALTRTRDAFSRTRDAFPRTRDAFSRTRDAFPRALTLVSAPAGFGKTTLISEWVTGCSQLEPKVRTAWLSLDGGDNDPARFLAYLIAALRTIEARHEYAGNIGKGVLGVLQSPEVAGATTPPPTEAILTSLINDLADLPDGLILVLDDYHLIEAQAIHEALIFLLEHLPPQMHLVIATREDPPLSLARLRAQGQLTELRASDLRFTSAEAAEFLNQVMGLDLAAEDIAVLERRTEGWIAGLQLAAISMQGREDTASLIQSFAGSHRYVLDYLVEEVLERQSESVQSFLLQTAILDRLTGSLCDAVRFGEAKIADRSIRAATPGGDAVCFGNAETQGSSSGTAVLQGAAGSRNGQATLEMLERANLFVVPLDEQRRWYRYHHLFADLLRQRLRQRHPEWVPTLHLRASDWCEQNGFVDEAIEHALHAEAFERAANLLEEHVDALWQRGQHTKLRSWLAGLPPDLVFSKPHLCILHAWDLFTSGQQDAAEESLQAAERALERGIDASSETPPQEWDHLSGSDRQMILGRAAAIRAFLAFYRGDAQGTREYARQALASLPEQDMTWRSTATVALGDAYSFAGDLAAAYRARSEAVEVSKAAGNIYMTLIASMKQAVTLRQQGQLQRVIEICQQQLELANESGLSQTVVVGWLLAIWGEVLAELNDLEGAIDRAKKGTELTERGKDFAALGWSYVCLVRILFSMGDMAGTQEAIQRMAKIAGETYVPPWIMNQMAAWQARIWLAQDELDAASQWAGGRGLDAGADPPYLRGMEYTVLARILIAQGRLAAAARLLQRLFESAESRGHASRAIEALNLQALAAQGGGDTTQAMTALERALALAESGGFVRIFVDEGPPMAHLLYEALSRGIAPDYVRRLLAAFPSAEPEHTEPVQAPESELIEPLSERQLEVLQLIAEGLTNREIASRLFLSLNTVKAHTRNIYGKLGVRSRTQAVARARGLGVLPSL
jgi:LuxR family maltose regulon positive regulatory protein